MLYFIQILNSFSKYLRLEKFSFNLILKPFLTIENCLKYLNNNSEFIFSIFFLALKKRSYQFNI